MKKDEFKEFVKKNPILISYVKKNEMTWQKFYEMYDLYGEDNSIWKDYLEKNNQESVNNNLSKNIVNGLTLNEFLNWFKNIDLDSIQEGIGNFQRVLGVVQDLSKGENDSNNTQSTYKPRPLYKHFED